MPQFDWSDEKNDVIFLKTITPSRKMTRRYFGRRIAMSLTEEEQRLLDSVEQGEWKTIPGFEQEAERYCAAARATLRKDNASTSG